MKSPLLPFRYKVGIALYRTMDDALAAAREQAKHRRSRNNSEPVELLEDGKAIAHVACVPDAVEPIVRPISA